MLSSGRAAEARVCRDSDKGMSGPMDLKETFVIPQLVDEHSNTMPTEPSGRRPSGEHCTILGAFPCGEEWVNMDGCSRPLPEPRMQSSQSSNSSGGTPTQAFHNSLRRISDSAPGSLHDEPCASMAVPGPLSDTPSQDTPRASPSTNNSVASGTGEEGVEWIKRTRGSRGSGKSKRGGAGKCPVGNSGAEGGRHVLRPNADQLALNKIITALESPSEILEALLDASAKGTDINATNLCTAIHRIAAKGGAKQPRVLRDPRLWALFQAIYTRLQDAGFEFTERELASTGWGLAKLGLKVDLILVELRKECERRSLEKFNWHDLSNLAWAHAVTPAKGEDWERWMMLLVKEAEKRDMEKIVPQVLCNLSWAVSWLHLPAKSLLQRIAERVTALPADTFKPLEVSSLLWSLAVADVPAGALFAKMSKRLVDINLEGYNTSKISAVACALAQTSTKADDLWEMIEEAIVERAMAGFNASNTAAIAWAFVSCDRSEETVESVMAMVEERVWQLGMKGFSNVQLVLLVYAFAKCNYQGPTGSKGKDTLNMVEVELRRRRVKDMSDMQLATLVWAFSRQGQPAAAGVMRLKRELMKRHWTQPLDDDYRWDLGDVSRVRRVPVSSQQPEHALGKNGYSLQAMGLEKKKEVVVEGGCWAVEWMFGGGEVMEGGEEMGIAGKGGALLGRKEGNTWACEDGFLEGWSQPDISMSCMDAQQLWANVGVVAESQKPVQAPLTGCSEVYFQSNW